MLRTIVLSLDRFFLFLSILLLLILSILFLKNNNTSKASTEVEIDLSTLTDVSNDSYSYNNTSHELKLNKDETENEYVLKNEAGENLSVICSNGDGKCKLTLNNVKFDSIDDNPAIYAIASIDVVLTGTNEISSKNGSIISMGDSSTNINIDGGGKLIAKSTGNSNLNKNAIIGAGNSVNLTSINISNVEIDVSSSESCDCAVIGGGYNSNSTNITITNCSITAINNSYGVGIGSGGCNLTDPTKSNILIANSFIVAESKDGGAGIGGGHNNYAEKIEIVNSTIEAIAANSGGGAGIGAGVNTSKKTVINISQSNVTASASDGAGIGGGVDSDAEVYIYKSSVSGVSNSVGAGIGSGYACESSVVIEESTIEAIGMNGAGIGGGQGDKSIDAPFGGGGCSSVKIMNSLVTAHCKNYGAGIGGGYHHATAASIEIYDCPFVTASSASDGAGIGGGKDFSPANILISHQTNSNNDSNNIYAFGGFYGAGIGGGYYDDYTNVVITGSSTKADRIEAYAKKNGVSNYAGAGIGGGKFTHDVSVIIKGDTPLTEIIAEGSSGAGIGGGSMNSLGTVTISSVSSINSTGIGYGAGIGGGDDDSPGTVTISSASSISAIGGGYGAGIGGGNYYSPGTVTITSVSSISATVNNSSFGGAGIGGGVSSTATVNITLVSSISAIGRNISPGIGAGGSNSFKNNIVISGSDTIPNSFFPNDTDLNIGIYGDAQVTAVGGEGSAGIGGSADENNSGKINIEIGDGSDNPKVTAGSKAMETDPKIDYPDDKRVNNGAAIGNGITSAVSSTCSAIIKINSGEIHAIDTASTASYSTTHSICIGGNNNETIPSSLEINGGDIYMYGNATFYQNGFGKGTDGMTLPSSALLHIGGTPPAIYDSTGHAISYPSNFKTTIRNFRTYGLKVSDGAKVTVDPSSVIFLNYEYDSSMSSSIPALPVGITAKAIQTTLSGRGLGEKIDVDYDFYGNIECESVNNNSVNIVLNDFIFTYKAIISPTHYALYGISKTNNVATVNKWITFSGTTANIDNLDEDTVYYIFLKANNKYFMGNDTTSIEVKTSKRNSFVITFIKNGGKGNMNPLYAYPNEKITLTKNTFKRTGYTFLKWNTEANGLGASYKDQYTFTKYTLGKNLQLYAIWKKNSSGGSSGSGGSGGSSGSGGSGTSSGGSSKGGGGTGKVINNNENPLIKHITKKGEEGYETGLIKDVVKSVSFKSIIVILVFIFVVLLVCLFFVGKKREILRFRK